MPRERRHPTTGTIVAERANWTDEEIIVWLDNRDKQEEDEYKRLELEFQRNGNKFTENSSRDIWARVQEEYTRDAERYIL